jgi:hypothetical protein
MSGGNPRREDRALTLPFAPEPASRGRLSARATRVLHRGRAGGCEGLATAGRAYSTGS